MFVDTHCHLLDADFDRDRAAVIRRAREAGVTHAIVMATTYEESVRNLAGAEEEPFLLAAAGQHPDRLDLAMLARTEALVRAHRERLVAIGEVGVDHRITEDPGDHALQDEMLVRFAHLSAEVDLPLSVHSRSAGRHAIALLAATPARKVIMHAFDGKYGSALAGLEAGFYFSVPPSIGRSRQKQKLVKQLPLDRLLLESDAPVLGPDPAARNEPANLVVAARAIAELKGLGVEEVCRAVAANTRRLFGV